MKSLLVSIIILASFTQAQTSGIKSYCNPIDINYQYNFEQKKLQISYRSAADPVIINHKGEYFLFATISGGWWYSKDLLNWNFVKPDKWPVEDVCAPAAISVRDTLFLFQSTFSRRPIYFLTDPKSGHLNYFKPLTERLHDSLCGPWDPSLFYDEDLDKWYMYWGSSNVYPIYGDELDKNNQLSFKKYFKKLIYLHPKEHGWERFGYEHRDTIKPFIEGAWMTKHNKKYYLMYGAPGTEYNVYANGVYTSDHPLGPFEYAPNNPVSYKPGGYVTGAGHGNTFQDNFGNWWNTGTPWLAVNWNFERRIAMFPAGFDDDGLMYSNTRFGDFPHYLPTEKWSNKNDLFIGWMLLSYRKNATASTMLDDFTPDNLTDENPRTFWIAENNNPGEWVVIDLKKIKSIRALQINFTDYKNNIYKSDSTVYTQFKIYSSTDNNNWKLIADLTTEKRDRPNAYIELPEEVKAQYIKYEHVYVASKYLAISDIRIFGNDDSPLPETPKTFSVKRDDDRRNAFIAWSEVKDAVGYNILWGIKSDKLYQTYQVFADKETKLELRALTLNQDYYFAIEAFNESGVSQLSETIYCK
ncbi:MAG: family 43 glycosylhydrolase [Ignavibacteriales bacterium]|nr:family 43 glycosylhydrolase [Ignavibacteriales bacterium]